MKPRMLSLALAFLLLTGCDSEPEVPARANDFEFVTPDGMTVRMIVNEGSGLFASNVFVGAGSTRETASTAGSSHFLEHLLFNGTTTMSQEELYEAVDRIGAYNNATTKREYTHYMMVAPQEELGTALGIQSAMLLHSTLPEDKFEKERGIVLEEINRDADSPAQARERRLRDLLYAGNEDFRRPVLGTPASIADLRREDVLDYYRARYRPSNMKLLLMGDFEPDAARALIEELFSGAPGQAAAPAPRLDWPRESRWAVDGADDEVVTVAVQLPAPPVGHPDHAAMAAITDALGGESGRVRRRLDERTAATIQAVSVELAHLHGQSLLEIRVEAAPGADPDEIAAAVFTELATVAETGLSAVEWTQARNRLLASSIRQVEQLHYYALLQGDLLWHASAGFESRFQTALADSYPVIGRVAADWLGSPVLKVAALAPGATSGSRTFDPAEAGYVADQGAESGLPLPGSGKLEGEVPRVSSVQAATVTRLENGLTLIHAASPDTRMFAIHVLVSGRSAREPADRPGMADLLHRCLPEGAGNYDGEELAALLDGIGAEWKVTDSAFIPYDDYYSTDPRFSFVRLDCVDLYWKEALRLVGLMLSSPTLEQEAIDRAREELAQRARTDAQKGSSVCQELFERALFGEEDPRSRPVFGTPTSLDGVDSRELQAFALDYLDPGQVIVSVVGNIARSELLEVARTHLGYGAASDHVAAGFPPLRLTDESVRVEDEVGGNQVNLRSGRVFEVDPADRWALEVATLVASERMQQDLRETRGWAYSLGISFDVEEGRGQLVARMGTRPEVADDAAEAVAGWLTCGRIDADEAEIEAAVNGNLGRQRMRRVTSMGRAFNLGYDWVFAGSVDADEERSAGMRAVTPEDVARVSGIYFVDAPRVTAVVR